MDRERLRRRLQDAGVDASPASPRPAGTLGDMADGCLALLGIAPGEADRVARALRDVPRTSAAAAALGSGFGAWSLSEADKVLHHGLERGAEVGDFVINNLEVLTAGWDAAAPEITNFMIEFALRLPDGTVKLGGKVLHLADHVAEVSGDVAGNVADAVDLGDALELAGVGADIADVVDGVTTLGLGILAGWLAKRAVEKHFEPQIQDRMNRLNALRARHARVAKVREMLRLELPAAMVAGHLNQVDRSHWAW